MPFPDLLAKLMPSEVEPMKLFMDPRFLLAFLGGSVQALGVLT
jgi:hypothetical protein